MCKGPEESKMRTSAGQRRGEGGKETGEDRDMEKGALRESERPRGHTQTPCPHTDTEAVPPTMTCKSQGDQKHPH